MQRFSNEPSLTSLIKWHRRIQKSPFPVKLDYCLSSNLERSFWEPESKEAFIPRCCPGPPQVIRLTEALPLALNLTFEVWGARMRAEKCWPCSAQSSCLVRLEREKKSLSGFHDDLRHWLISVVASFSLSGLCAIVACSWFAHNVIRAFYNPYTALNTK